MTAARRLGPFGALAIAWIALVGHQALAMSPVNTNIVDLLTESSAIVVGHVQDVTDGIDQRGNPYTEITLTITETIRGNLSGSYTFRQFGLLKPRLTADGKRKMMPSPAGFPTYVPGEDTLLFLRPAASWTGFRMPAGVSQGKFSLIPGRAENDMGNAGLFYNVRIDKRYATREDRKLLASSGAVNPEAFLAFVRRAVGERWVENGRLARADVRGGTPVVSSPDLGTTSPQQGAGKPAPEMPPTQPLDPNANVGLATKGAGR